MLKYEERQSDLPLYNEFFLDLINNNYSERTVANYQRDIEAFESFLLSEEIEFKKFTKLDVSRFKEYLRTGKYLKSIRNFRKTKLKTESARGAIEYEKSSPDTPRRLSMYSGRLSTYSVNRMLSTLRTFFRFLNEADRKIPISPDSIKLVKNEKKIGHVAELIELTHLIEAPEKYENKTPVKLRNRAMLELLFATGMRISELMNLNTSDFKLDETKTKILENRIYVVGKGNKQRFVYLTDRAKFHVEEYLKIRKDKYPALFIPYRGLRIGTQDPYIVRVSTNYLQGKIKEYRLKLGIILPTSAHSLRHGFATYLAEKGANPAAIQKLLGHESLQTTSKYVHSSDKFAEESHDKFHPLANK